MPSLNAMSSRRWIAFLTAGAILSACGNALAAKPRRSAPSSRASKKPAPAKSASIKFTPSPLELGPGEKDILEVRLLNPYGHATVGTLKLSETADLSISGPEWDGSLPPWGAKLYLQVKASPNATPGAKTVHATYYVDGAGDFTGDLRYRIVAPIKAELIPDYANSAVKVRVTNLTSGRTERGRVELRSVDRLLQDQVSAEFPPIPPGETREVSIPVVKGGIAPGIGYRFEAMAQTWAGYRTTFARTLVFYGSPR